MTADSIRMPQGPKKPVGILAFGSLIPDPGDELAPKIIERIKTKTPFGVEYGRYSGKTRGGAPTLVPHEDGAPVNGEILVLAGDVGAVDARSMLWRRERRKTGSKEEYSEGSTANSVLVRVSVESSTVESLLYTDFNAEGKITKPNPQELAKRAIQSVNDAEPGKDGITYLMDNISAGIETPLTVAYRAEILKQTQSRSLKEALDWARSQ